MCVGKAKAGRAGRDVAWRGNARQGGFCEDCCFIKKMVCKVTYSHCGSAPPPCVGVCAYNCVCVCSCLSACGSVCAVSPFIYFYDVSFLAFY